MNHQAELEQLIRVRHLPPGVLRIEADAEQCAALAARFGLCAVRSLVAEVELHGSGNGIVRADGSLTAVVEQECAVSREPFATTITEPLALVFTPVDELPAAPDDEVELDGAALDEIGYSGDSFDLGEAVAQTLGLAIDPYATGPGADAVRAEAGIISDDAPAGSLAQALAQLKLR